MRLPSLPSTYFELLKQIESPHATTEDIGGVILRDPAATARVLQVVNSAALGMRQKITDPVQAVSLLGVETVKSLVLCLQVFEHKERVQPAGISFDHLWSHSVAVAETARQLIQIQTGNSRLANDAFTAGLLHDVGRIVLASNLPEEYGKTVAAAKQKNCELALEENNQLGVTHAQAGAYLLGLWGMPAFLVEAVALHHSPELALSREFSLLAAVHVANVLALDAEPGNLGLPLPALDTAYLSDLGVPTSIQDWRDTLAGHGETPKKTASPPPTPSTAAVPPAPSPAPESLEIQPQPASRTGRVWTPVLALAVLVIGACWWFTRSHRDAWLTVEKPPASGPAAESVAPAPAKAAPAPPTAVPAPVVTQPAPVQAVEPTPPPTASTSQVASATVSNVPPAAPAPAAPATPTPAAAPRTGFDSVKVQGIFYRASNPTVMINGKLLSRGDRINGVEVVSIEPVRVILRFGTEQKTFQIK